MHACLNFKLHKMGAYYFNARLSVAWTPARPLMMARWLREMCGRADLRLREDARAWRSVGAAAHAACSWARFRSGASTWSGGWRWEENARWREFWRQRLGSQTSMRIMKHARRLGSVIPGSIYFWRLRSILSDIAYFATAVRVSRHTLILFLVDVIN